MKAAIRDHHHNVVGFGTRRFGFFKGQWYWERQFGWLVISILHDGAHQPSSRRFHVGPVYLWNGHSYKKDWGRPYRWQLVSNVAMVLATALLVLVFGG
jgi:hypothetical protein